MIPFAAEGYAVDRDSRRVHLRYADHAEGLPRTRTLTGVDVILRGLRPLPCRDCWPHLRQPRVKRP